MVVETRRTKKPKVDSAGKRKLSKKKPELAPEEGERETKKQKVGVVISPDLERAIVPFVSPVGEEGTPELVWSDGPEGGEKNVEEEKEGEVSGEEGEENEGEDNSETEENDEEVEVSGSCSSVAGEASGKAACGDKEEDLVEAGAIKTENVLSSKGV